MNVKSLAYLVVQSTDLAKWVDYGTNVCGMMQAPSMAKSEAIYLKMDQRTFRYMVVPGPFDGLLYAGWKLENEAAFIAAIEELKTKGIVFELVTDTATLASRSANGLVRSADPSGNQFEIFWSNSDTDKVAFTSPLDSIKGFVTTSTTGEDMGLGHVVLHAPTNFEGVHDFYRSIGFMDADITDMNAKGLGNIYFMNCNARHHSLALWNWGGPCPESNFMPSPESKAPGCVHVMAEVQTLGEVGACLDRVNDRKIPVISSLGEHINDQMVSFYMLTPGNFALEFGHAGLQLDANWKTTHNTDASIWGHKWNG